MLRTPKSAKVSILSEVTARKFDGGLNVADSELNLSSKYARVLENVIVGIDGSLEIRQGCKLFASLEGYSDYPIVAMQYFRTYIVAVNTRGEIFAISASSTITPIWNAGIAAALRPGLTIWSDATFVEFVEFNGQLHLANGVDKPLIVSAAMKVDYLADLATGSNINVPIGRVMEAFSNHFFIADGYMLHISERNASGTWQGDVGTQFVNQFDMRVYVTSGDTTIIGLHKFKNFLLVCFREVIVPIQIVEDAAATPKLNIVVSADSVIENYGSFSSRTSEDVGDEILNCDITGVSSFALSRFTKIMSPDRPSRFVDPLLQPAISALDIDTLRNNTFSTYDRRLSAYMLFIPDNKIELQTESTVYVYRNIERLNLEAWHTFTGWNASSVARSSEGRIFFSRANDKTIFVIGDSKVDAMDRDFIGEQELFSDNTPYSDNTGHTPVADVYDSGVPILWKWEVPWTDLKHRGLTKTLRYVIFDTEGSEQFTTSIFVDDHYSQPDHGESWDDEYQWDDNLGWSPNNDNLLTPALQYQLIGKDAGGYGNAPYGSSPYGGGNNTKQRSLTLTPTKFTTMKMRMHGEALEPLKFVAITLLYQQGSIRRLP